MTWNTFTACGVAAICVAAGSTASAQSLPGFAIPDGFPVTVPSSSADGGMFVNLDADPELEIVQIAGDLLYGLNLDGTAVPGWPVSLTIGRGNWGAPAYGDIDGDGEGEIVAHSFFFGLSSDIYAFETDGTPVPGFPVGVGGGFRSPSLADVDGDDDLEIVFTGNSGGIGTVYVIDGDGQMLPGWPVQFQDNVGDPFDRDLTAGHTPAVADLDGDGTVEVVLASYLQLYVFGHDGVLEDGYPWTPPAQGHAFNSYSSPSLVDLDDDADLEIVFTTSAGGPLDQLPPDVHVLNLDGTQVAGWPQQFPQPFASTSGIFIPVSVADLDVDGSLDIVVGDNALAPQPVNTVMAWDRFGAALPGFPTEAVNALLAQITVADIDGDGTPELFFDDNVAGTGAQRVFNHDGTPFDGADLAFGGAFRQLASFDDANGDGMMDMLVSSNDQINMETDFYVFMSEAIPWSPERAPVATYQYSYTRDGVVPAFGGADCAADWDGNGVVNAADVGAFLSDYFLDLVNDTLVTDFDGNGVVNAADVGAFLSRYFQDLQNAECL